MILHQDCRHFRSDVPCSFHKLEGVHCDGCQYYDPINFRILIVKLDAMGDVLRTTCLLPGLKNKYPGSHITWLTRRESTPLFVNNPYVDRVLDYSPESVVTVQLDEYDLVLGLDASPASAKITSTANGKMKLGFGYDKRGFSYPLNSEATTWYEMGLFDDIKKKNNRTYQEIMAEIVGIAAVENKIIFKLTEEEKAMTRALHKRLKLKTHSSIIGINAGAGRRWSNKKWHEKHAITLIKLLMKAGHHVLLLGGEEEKELNVRIVKAAGSKVIDTGCNHSVRVYAAIVDLCDVVVTMDTFTLHLGLALGKQMISLFGPTSAVEIEMYNQGEKILPDVECSCYYQKTCTADRQCMETIEPKRVFEAIQKLAAHLTIRDSK